MRQYKVVHSPAEERLTTFFNRLFMTLKAEAVWETYEYGSAEEKHTFYFQKPKGPDAIFLILSADADCRQYLKAWFTRQTSISAQTPIWAFVHCQDIKNVSAKIPSLRHQILMYVTPAWTDYVEKLIGSEGEKKRIIPEVLRVIPFTEKLNDYFDPQTSSAVGDYSTSSPLALEVQCPRCAAQYRLHAPLDLKVFKCLVCDQFAGLVRQSIVAPKGH